MSGGASADRAMGERQPTEEELRAYEEELSRITAGQVVLQTLATLITIGGRRLGLGEQAEKDRDLEQARDAIDAARALLPILERRMPAQQLRPLRDALSQLQMGYAQLAQSVSSQAHAQAEGGEPAAAGTEQSKGEPDRGVAGAQGVDVGDSAHGSSEQQGPGPAERSGRLWVPGRD